MLCVRVSWKCTRAECNGYAVSECTQSGFRAADWARHHAAIHAVTAFMVGVALLKCAGFDPGFGVFDVHVGVPICEFASKTMGTSYARMYR